MHSDELTDLFQELALAPPSCAQIKDPVPSHNKIALNEEENALEAKQSLQDMEEKVTQVLRLIEEDGDSFAKRAEMYYKKRPEIIHFVQETYRAYRGLAERYDLMSKELQKANSTLASAFPGQFQDAMDDDDHDSSSPGLPAKHVKNLKIPDAPKRFPAKKIRAAMALTSKNTDRDKASAGISKDQALEEIDKLQKAILTSFRWQDRRWNVGKIARSRMATRSVSLNEEENALEEDTVFWRRRDPFEIRGFLGVIEIPTLWTILEMGWNWSNSKSKHLDLPNM